MILKKHIILMCGAAALHSLTLLSMREVYNPHGIQIGIYSGAGYNFLKDLRENSGDKKLSVNSLPKELITLIPAGAEIKNYLILLGSPESKAAESVYNIAYHPTVRGWLEHNPAVNLHNFSLPVAMGIFHPQGVAHVNSAEGIAFNRLSDQQVIIHPGAEVAPGYIADAYSPNNARFQIDPKNTVSNFWTMAVSPDKKQVYTAYVILVQNDLLEKEIEENRDLGLDQVFSKAINSKHSDSLAKKILKEALVVASPEKAQMHAAAHQAEEKAAAGSGDDDIDLALALSLSEQKSHGHKNAGLSDEEALALAVKNSITS